MTIPAADRARVLGALQFGHGSCPWNDAVLSFLEKPVDDTSIRPRLMSVE